MAGRGRPPARPLHLVDDALVDRALLEGGLMLVHHDQPNLRRRYRLRLQPGLFGGLDLVREWGRDGSRERRPALKVEPQRDLWDAREGLRLAALEKVRGGYRPRSA